jgi:hypothetical protein
MYFDMFYIHWHRLAKKDVRNKVPTYEYEYQYEIQYGLNVKVVYYITCISSIL